MIKCNSTPNNIVLSVDDQSDLPNGVNSAEPSPLTGMSARVPFDNNTNVISKAVLHTPNEPRFVDSIDVRFEDQQEVHRSKLQPVNTAKQSAISERRRLSEKQVAQHSFDDQIKEYIQKHKRSCFEKYKKKSNPTQKKLYHPRSRRRVNRIQKGPGCGQHTTISSVNLNGCPEKKV